MKILNFFLFPFKLIFYILHILYLDILVNCKCGLLPIFEDIDFYKECWNKHKNIDLWYKEIKNSNINFLKRLKNKKDNEFLRINCIFPTDRKRFLWWYIE